MILCCAITKQLGARYTINFSLVVLIASIFLVVFENMISIVFIREVKVILSSPTTAILKLSIKFMFVWLEMLYLYLLMPLFKDFACEVAQTQGVQYYCEYPPCAAVDTSMWPSSNINVDHPASLVNQTQSCILSLTRECFRCHSEATLPRAFDTWLDVYFPLMIFYALMSVLCILLPNRVYFGLGILQQKYVEKANVHPDANDYAVNDSETSDKSDECSSSPNMLCMHQKMLSQTLAGGRTVSVATDENSQEHRIAAPIWMSNVTQHNFQSHSTDAGREGQTRHLFEITPFSIGSTVSGFNRVYSDMKPGSAITMGSAMALSGAAASSNLGVFAEESPLVQVPATCIVHELTCWNGSLFKTSYLYSVSRLGDMSQCGV